MKITFSVCVAIVIFIIFITYDIHMNDKNDVRPEMNIQNMIYSPDGKYLITVNGIDNQLKISDIKTGKTILKVKPDIPILSILPSPDGKTLAVSDNNHIEIINLNTGKITNIL